MEPNWLGPYHIHEVTGKNTYRLCRFKGTKKERVLKILYNISRLKLYYASSESLPSRSSDHQDQQDIPSYVPSSPILPSPIDHNQDLHDVPSSQPFLQSPIDPPISDDIPPSASYQDSPSSPSPDQSPMKNSCFSDDIPPSASHQDSPSSPSPDQSPMKNSCLCVTRCATRRCPCRLCGNVCGKYCHPGRSCCNKQDKSKKKTVVDITMETSNEGASLSPWVKIGSSLLYASDKNVIEDPNGWLTDEIM